ncbi:ATP synthase delta chain, chloroplastic-like [Bidens hawaiensis]|uniref:ATP synthase delta chain, chloroplastic-like n=1 Tax=Bidens hawaiensis TaxID=980011 RepID=UPI0040491736
METISTSVPYIPKIPPRPHYFHHLKPPLLLHSTTVAGKPSASISTKPTPQSHHKYTPKSLQYQSIPSQSRLQTHRTNAATGYAAALVDAALCNNSLDAIHRDVKRLLKWLNCNEMLKDLMKDSFVEESVKGRVIKEVAEKGKFQRQVVAMVKMLVAKNKSGLVVKVMEEFEGIYCQLNNGSKLRMC